MDKIKEYFRTKAVSNSFLGSMWNPKWVKFKFDNPDAEDDDKVHFRIGGALDCLLTSPERWEQDFAVVDANKPFGLMGKFIEELPGGLEKDSDLRLYQEAYNASGYKMWMDKVVAKFWENEEFVKYYKLTRDLGDGLIVLSADEYDAVTKAHELILANEYARGYFINKDPINIELLHQVPIYFDYYLEDECEVGDEGGDNTTPVYEPCKALLDGVRINHKDRTIEPFDLKTTRSVYDFPSSFLQYGYYRQAAFYLYALQSENSPVRKYLDEGYIFLPFIFLAVENKKSSSHPVIIYETSLYDIHVGRYGGSVKGKSYKGWEELMEDYQYHKRTDYWDLPVDLIKSKGRIKLNVFDDSSTEESEFYPPNVRPAEN